MLKKAYKILNIVFSKYKLRHMKDAESPIRIERDVVISNKKIKIGRYTFIGKGASIGRNTESIGRYCSLASGCVVGLNYHPMEKLSTSAAFYSKSWGIYNGDVDYISSFQEGRQTIIKNDVWVGANVIILGGVSIGNGAVIGAGSVVTKDVPDYAVVAGNPAKIIRYRFNEGVIKKLLYLKWWEKEPKMIIDLWGMDVNDIVKN